MHTRNCLHAAYNARQKSVFTSSAVYGFKNGHRQVPGIIQILFSANFAASVVPGDDFLMFLGFTGEHLWAFHLKGLFWQWHQIYTKNEYWHCWALLKTSPVCSVNTGQRLLAILVVHLLFEDYLQFLDDIKRGVFWLQMNNVDALIRGTLLLVLPGDVVLHHAGKCTHHPGLLGEDAFGVPVHSVF